MKKYQTWWSHGDRVSAIKTDQCSNPGPQLGGSSNSFPAEDVDAGFGEYRRYEHMITSHMQAPVSAHYHEEPQHPNREAQQYYNLMQQAQEPLWDGCQTETTLSATTQLLEFKSRFNLSSVAFDHMLSLFRKCTTGGGKLPMTFYETKKVLKPLIMESEKIHACIKHCCLFWKHNHKADGTPYSLLEKCPVCNTKRYKKYGHKVPKLVLSYMPIGPRLQRRFHSRDTTKHMTWNSNHSFAFIALLFSDNV